METQAQAIEQWRRAADREAREGNTAIAITFRNMAWLVEHADSWMPKVIKSASAQAQEHVANLQRLAGDGDDDA